MSIAASSLLFKSVVATGNSRQDLTHEIEFHGSVKQRNTTAWATQLPEVQTVQCTETMRFGEPLVSRLKSIAPILDSLTTATKRSAYWLPVWIKKPTLATTYVDTEIGTKRVMFANILNLLAMELVIAVSSANPSSILIAYYLQFAA